MATDPEQVFVEKLVTILDTAAGVVAVTNQASANVVPDLTAAAAVPFTTDGRRGVIAYTVVSGVPPAEIKGLRRYLVQLDAFAAKMATARELLHAAESAATASAFAAGPQALDARPGRGRRRGVPQPAGGATARATCDIPFVVQS